MVHAPHALAQRDTAAGASPTHGRLWLKRMGFSTEIPVILAPCFTWRQADRLK
jgi:hypothetical protein